MTMGIQAIQRWFRKGTWVLLALFVFTVPAATPDLREVFVKQAAAPILQPAPASEAHEMSSNEASPLPVEEAGAEDSGGGSVVSVVEDFLAGELECGLNPPASSLFSVVRSLGFALDRPGVVHRPPWG